MANLKVLNTEITIDTNGILGPGFGQAQIVGI